MVRIVTEPKDPPASFDGLRATIADEDDDDERTGESAAPPQAVEPVDDPFAPKDTDIAQLPAATGVGPAPDMTVAEGLSVEESPMTEAAMAPVPDEATQFEDTDRIADLDGGTAMTAVALKGGTGRLTPAGDDLSSETGPMPGGGPAAGSRFGVTNTAETEVPEAVLAIAREVQRQGRKLARHVGATLPVEFDVGGYHVHRRLGSGGMAEVFLAKPPGGDFDVVVKKLHPQLMSKERYRKLFEREARVAFGLEHENIVRILDFGEDTTGHFMIMEYLDGSDLRDVANRWWAAERALPVEAICRVIADAARGLDYAHSQGAGGALVHRDISPENLFLTRSGRTKVLDFGVAKPADQNESLTTTGEIKGKVPYMAPEQIMGKPLAGRADLWALSVVFYWLLTGARPFDGPNEWMTIKSVIETEPVAVRDVNPRVPDDVDAIVMWGLTKDRDQRIASGAALADALDALLKRTGHDEASVFAAQTDDLDLPDFEPAPASPAAAPVGNWSIEPE